MFLLYFATIFYCQFNKKPIWRARKSVLLNQRCWTFHFKIFPDILEPFKMRIFRWRGLMFMLTLRWRHGVRMCHKIFPTLYP